MLRGARLWRQIADREVEGFGLSEATVYPLVFIARLGNGIRQSTLAESLGMEGPSLVRLLDQLCAAGYVQRREDPTDKRAKTLHLTAEGAALAATLLARLDERRRLVFETVTDGELHAALAAFAALDRAAASGRSVKEAAL